MNTVICKDTNETCHTYQEYLKSEHWRLLKSRYWKSKLTKNCAVCKASGARYDMHHKTYKRIGREWLQDIVPVCRHCHEIIHQIAKNSAGRDIFKATKKAQKIAKRMSFKYEHTPEKKRGKCIYSKLYIKKVHVYDHEKGEALCGAGSGRDAKGTRFSRKEMRNIYTYSVKKKRRCKRCFELLTSAE